MKNRTIRYLQIGLILISVLCIGVFSFLALYMKKKSSDTISEVGNIYMSGMNERIRMHFQTTNTSFPTMPRPEGLNIWLCILRMASLR